MVLGTSHLSSEVRSTKDGPDLSRRFCLTLVIARLGPSVTNVVPGVTVTDELLDLVFEHDALLCGMADIFVISAVLVLVSSRVVSSQLIRSLVDACLLGG